MKQLDAYRQLLNISTQMMALANSQQWDDVEQLQQQRSAIILMMNQYQSSLLAKDIEILRRIILEIQKYDAAILDLALPSHTDMGKLLAGLDISR